MEGEESMGILERVAHQREAREAVACSGTGEGGNGHKSGGPVDGYFLRLAGVKRRRKL